MAKRIRLALDWTPNTIHTGFYVAASKGYYDDAGLEVEFLLPDADNYTMSPAQKVAADLADLAIVPTESIISFQTKADPVPLVAIATILAKDASAIVTRQDSGITRPAMLDGKRYASYRARFEDAIVQQLVRQDGGRGELDILHPPRLGIWDTLLRNEADATWIFLPWEGIEARLQGVQLNVFQLKDYGIPYGYSPVIAGLESFIRKKKVRKFLKASAKGFLFAKNNPIEAAELLRQAASHATLQQQALVEQSQVFIAQYYFDENGNWGIMQHKVWADFLDWLNETAILSPTEMEKLDIYRLFTNELLEP
ncbi:MAG TPA: ABC transporter substrate-binding protein [Saprospiraceae bacterium]|nr:ABC transporter substrate-binding protein [Saprospiraceae bacterium]HMP23282.1 ABC transporter substrate-binding protein [Saprospiraceae bacterium]